MNNAMVNALDKLYEEVYEATLFPDFARERDLQSGRERVRREILLHFRSKTFTIEDVKVRCMQETDCVLKEGDYRKVVLDMREEFLERLESGPIRKESRFKVRRPGA